MRTVHAGAGLGGPGAATMTATVVQIVRVAPPDPLAVEVDRAVAEIERVVGHLDLHQRIAVEWVIETFGDVVVLGRCDPWC